MTFSDAVLLFLAGFASGDRIGGAGGGTFLT
ncbi:MAG: sulfite exporter TauE/SafE family protein, partial [Mesorhizobium sp.]